MGNKVIRPYEFFCVFRESFAVFALTQGDRMMKFKIKSKLAFRNIGGVFFIVDAEKETLHELNELGSFSWNHIVKKRNSAEIVKKISEEFEVGFVQAKKDFDDFINKLKEKGLVQ